MPHDQPVRLAVLGAGIFVKDAYVPLLRCDRGSSGIMLCSYIPARTVPPVRAAKTIIKHTPCAVDGTGTAADRRSTSSVTVVALWSRSEQAAAALLPDFQEFAPGARAQSGDAGLQAILDDPGVDAVAIVLPADVQLQVCSPCTLQHCSGVRVPMASRCVMAGSSEGCGLRSLPATQPGCWLLGPAFCLIQDTLPLVPNAPACWGWARLTSGTLQLAERALAAGKAVLQEKPIAQTAAAARAAIERHRSQANPPVWGIAENYR